MKSRTDQHYTAPSERPDAQKRDQPDGSTQGDSDLPGVFVFFNEIGIINQLSSRMFEHAMGDDLTLPQFSVLNNLIRVSPESSPLRLAKAFQVAKSAMTKTLGHLEGKGYVTVSPDPKDGRGKVVRITLAGRQARDRAVAAIAPALADVLAHIGVEGLKSTLPVLTDVRRYLDAARD